MKPYDPCKALAVGFVNDCNAYVYLKDIVFLSGLSESTLRKRIAKGLFPSAYGDEFGRSIWRIDQLPNWLRLVI